MEYNYIFDSIMEALEPGQISPKTPLSEQQQSSPSSPSSSSSTSPTDKKDLFHILHLRFSARSGGFIHANPSSSQTLLVSEIKPIIRYTVLDSGSFVYYCCCFMFFRRLLIEQTTERPSLNRRNNYRRHNQSLSEIFVPTCLFVLSRVAAPASLCSLLEPIMKVFVENVRKEESGGDLMEKKERVEELLHFLLRDCMCPIPGVLGISIEIRGIREEMIVHAGHKQLQNGILLSFPCYF